MSSTKSGQSNMEDIDEVEYNSAGIPKGNNSPLATNGVNILDGDAEAYSESEPSNSFYMDILAGYQEESERFPEPALTGEVSDLTVEEYERFKNSQRYDSEKMAVLPTPEAVEKHEKGDSLVNYIWEDEESVVVNDISAEVINNQEKLYQHLDQISEVPTIAYMLGDEFLTREMTGGSAREVLGEEREGVRNGYLVSSLESDDRHVFEHMDEVNDFLEENQKGNNSVDGREDYFVLRGLPNQSRTSINIVGEPVNAIRYKDYFEDGEEVADLLPYERDIWPKIFQNLVVKDNLEYLSIEEDEEVEQVPEDQLEIANEINRYFSPQRFTRTDEETYYPSRKTSSGKIEAVNPVRFRIDFEEVMEDDITHLPEDKQEEIRSQSTEEPYPVVSNVDLQLDQFATPMAEYNERPLKEKTPIRTFDLLRQISGEEPLNLDKLEEKDTLETRRLESHLNPKPVKNQLEQLNNLFSSDESSERSRRR